MGKIPKGVVFQGNATAVISRILITSNTRLNTTVPEHLFHRNMLVLGEGARPGDFTKPGKGQLKITQNNSEYALPQLGRNAQGRSSISQRAALPGCFYRKGRQYGQNPPIVDLLKIHPYL
ncbi:MAG: hypothetical protein IPJ00_21160, partial [Saprospirales bacterium]|nr:hypothetical protein [Saprospirales bacterium]